MLLAAGVLIGTLTLWRPERGLALYFALLPVLAYLYEGRGESPLPVMLPTVFVAMAVGLRLLIWEEGFRLRVGVLFLLVGSFVVSSASHFGTLILDHPRVVLDSLLDTDQLNPFVFFSEGVLWCTAGLLFLGVVHSAFDDRKRMLLYRGLIVQGVLFLFLLILDGVLHGKPIPGYWVSVSQRSEPGLYAMFDEHNTLGAYCLLQASLALGLIRTQRWVLGLVLTSGYLLVMVSSLSLSSMLVGVLTAVGVLVGLVLLYRPESVASFARRYSRVLIVGLFGSLVVAASLGAVYRLLDPPVRDRLVVSRLAELRPESLLEALKERRWAAWAVAAAMVRDYPLYGVGLGRFYSQYEFYIDEIAEAEQGYLFRTSRHENAHNYYLQVAAESGLVGLLLLISGLVLLLRRCRWSDPLAGPAGLAVITLALVSLLQHPMLVELLFLTLAGVAGLCWSSVPKRPRVRSSGRVMLIGALIAALAYPWHLFKVWDDIPPRFEYGLYPAENGPDGPFRWTSGPAFLRWDRDPGRISLRVLSQDPKMSQDPQITRFELNGELVGHVALSSPGWQVFDLESGPGAVLGIIPARTFRVPADPRRLGVALQGLPGLN